MGDADIKEAFKAAYAKVVLNTSKEAAARVIFSDKTAASFQHQLNCSKEESLRLLLRLKQMIAVNTIEAERTSLCQKRKIEELEAQLHEAEDIIIDLRAEISSLRDKLESAETAQVNHLSGQITSENPSCIKDPTSEPTVQSSQTFRYMTVADSDLKNILPNQGKADNIYSNAARQIDLSSNLIEEKETPLAKHSNPKSYNPHNSDLATVVTASNKSELYNNACTQRICAPERNLTDSKFTPGNLDCHEPTLRDEFSMETSDADETHCTRFIPKTKSLKALVFSGEETKKSVKVQPKRRRRKTQISRTIAGSCGSCPDQHMKPCQSSSIPPHSRTYTVNGIAKPIEAFGTVSSIRDGNMNKTKFSKEFEDEFNQKSGCHEDEDAGTYNGKRNKKAESDKDIATSFQSLSDQLSDPCQLLTVLSCSKSSVCSDVKSNEDRVKTAEAEIKIKPLAHLDPQLTLVACKVDPLSGPENVSLGDRALDNSSFVQSAADNEMKLGDEAVLMRQECSSWEISTLPFSEKSSNMVNVSFRNSELKDAEALNVTNESSTQVDNVNDRLLKYTFLRKRKKESLSNSDEKTSEDNDMRLGDEALLSRQEPNSGNTSILPYSEMSFNVVNVSFMSSKLRDAKQLNINNDVSTEGDNVDDRLLKYTFCRKRKKESLDNLDENTSEESSSKRSAGEKESSLPETAKSSLVNESSRDSR